MVLLVLAVSVLADGRGRSETVLEFTDNDFCELARLLASYATHELDQFDHWKLETRWGTVYVEISREAPAGAPESASTAIWPPPAETRCRRRLHASTGTRSSSGLEWDVSRMRALQVTRNGPPGEVLEVVDVPIRSRAERRGAGEGRRGVAELQRHRPVPGKARLGSHPSRTRWAWMPAAWWTRPGPGCEAWLGQRVVAITKMALGGIAEYAIADGVLGLRRSARTSTTPRRPRSCCRSRRRTWRCSGADGCRQARRSSVHSAASGLGTAGIQLARAAGARVIAVAGGPGEDGAAAPRSAPILSSTTRPRTSSRRCWRRPGTPGRT